MGASPRTMTVHWQKAYARRMRTKGTGKHGKWIYAAAAAGWLLADAGLIAALRQWRLRVREADQRALDAERTREEAAQRRAMEERLRIARELHDSLTHSISVIQIQSGVAVHLARKRGDDVPPVLLAIQEAATDAGRELRATLGVLRDSSGDQESDGSGLDQLDTLVTRACSAGLPVTVFVSGAERPLPLEVDRAAYRIVQEALTNVSRHAGPAKAEVHLHYQPDALTIQVSDDGEGADTGSAGLGLGLIGMRERVSALGGSLNAGPLATRGFQVTAELPVSGFSARREP